MPIQRTASRKAKFIRAIERNAHVTDAARLAGIDRSLPYKWASDDKTFAHAWDMARARRIPQLKDRAFEEAMEGDKPMLRFLLEKYDVEASTTNQVDTIRIILPTDEGVDEHAEFFS